MLKEKKLQPIYVGNKKQIVTAFSTVLFFGWKLQNTQSRQLGGSKGVK